METILAIDVGLVLLEKLTPYIQKLIETAKRDSELTPDQEIEFDARMQAIINSDAWKPRVVPFVPPTE